MTDRQILIEGRAVGDNASAMVVAEISANHGRDLNIALETIDVFAEAGADAIKLQTYTADSLTLKSHNSWFQVNANSIWDGRSLWDLYDEAHTPWEWHAELFDRAHQRGLACFSSAFDDAAIDFLQELDTPAFKIASFEITDTRLISRAASTGKPIILSTGIGTYEEIAAAVRACRDEGNENIILLKCTSSYPAELDAVNVRTMTDMREQFRTLVGFSDHTTSDVAAVTAVARGACMIEKHVILDRAIGGPDASFSSTPDDFRKMVRRIRETETALGVVNYSNNDSPTGSRQLARSLFVVQDVNPGDEVTEQNIRSIRPSDGLPPSNYSRLLGKRFKISVERGTPLSLDQLESFDVQF